LTPLHEQLQALDSRSLITAMALRGRSTEIWLFCTILVCKVKNIYMYQTYSCNTTPKIFLARSCNTKCMVYLCTYIYK